MPEIWDILDENGRKTGMTAERPAMLGGQVAGYHLVVHVYINNRQGQWLIQKRSDIKEIWPGLWDITGGAALAGEDSLSAARREVEEEIGVRLDPSLMFIERRLCRKHSLIDIWVAYADFAIEDCRLDPAEVAEARWVDADSLVKIIFEAEYRDDEYKSIVEGMTKSRTIWVVPYDPAWKNEFENIKAILMPQIGDLILDIVHIGSTSVEGLAAKPIIDFNIVIESFEVFPALAGRLRDLGYEHQGDGGIPGRECFHKSDDPGCKTSHMYVCARNGREHLRNLAFRDYLRSHAGAREAYASLKHDLAARFRHDFGAYIDGKHEFVEAILEMAKI
jgi:GrpB-like predicted nucleotidyltransferase (UPF0157 family)/8-oxo-dGTP pyrophosphatase MutT (NUDIX family)